MKNEKTRVVYHVIPDTSGTEKDWRVKKEGNQRATRAFTDKRRAVDFAMRLAKSADLGQVKVHNRHGQIQTEWTYGNDPVRYPG